MATVGIDHMISDEGRWVQESILVELQEAPEELVAMRRVLNGQPPNGEKERFLKTWMESKPGEFMAAKNRAETAYRTEQKLKLASGGQGLTPAGEDEGLERSVELAREWLENRGK